MSRSLALIVVGVTGLLLGASSLLPAEKPAVDKPAAKATNRTSPTAKVDSRELRPLERETAIEEALAKPTEMCFTDTPLSDVILFLKDHHGIEIQLDGRALSDAGVEASTPVTKNIKGISLRSALDLMLRDLNLTWTIQDEVLLITTPEEGEARLTRQVLDVGDLVTCQDSKGELWDDYDSLIRMIESTVMPTTWIDAGGPARSLRPISARPKQS